jgi:RNA polymerase sigma-70 factor (ECF subfamily)
MALRHRTVCESPEPAGAPEPDEEALIAACRAGNRSALSTVLGEHIAVLERVILKLIWDPTDAEDVLQQTLTTAVECFPRFRGDSAIQTWLIGIAIGISRNHARRQQRRSERAAAPSSVSSEIATAASAEETAHDRALLERLQQHLSKLSQKQREVWVLHVLEGRNMDEIAIIVGTNRFTAKSRLRSARNELRQRMNADPALSARSRGGTA